MGKISNWFKKQITALALATANVEKNAFGQEGNNLDEDSGKYQRHNQGTLADALERGEITQEVKELRWRMFKILEASDKALITILGADEEGYLTLDVEQPNPTGLKVLLNKVRVDDFDDYPLEMVVNNKPITLGSIESLTDEIKEYDYDERKSTVREDDGSFVATLGEISSDTHQSSMKMERPVKVLRELRPKFEIEKFSTKLNVRKINDSERLLEFYVSIYPDEYDKTSKLFLSELKRAIQNPRSSNMLDMLSVGFTTYKTIGVKDFHQFQYRITGFDKIVEFDGHYIIKFKSEVIINGEYLLSKYRLSDLDEKYNNKVKKN